MNPKPTRRPDRHQLAAVRQAMHADVDKICDAWLAIDAMWDGYQIREPTDIARSDADDIRGKGGHGNPTPGLAINRNPARDWLNCRAETQRLLQQLAEVVDVILPGRHLTVCAECRQPIGHHSSHKVDGRHYHATTCYHRFRRRANSANGNNR